MQRQRQGLWQKFERLQTDECSFARISLQLSEMLLKNVHMEDLSLINASILESKHMVDCIHQHFHQ